MKKIKSIKQLRAEKRKLRQRTSELERKIKNGWEDLKKSFTEKADRNYSESPHNGREEYEKKRNGFFEDTFAFIAERFARKMAGKAGEKFGSWFKK